MEVSGLLVDCRRLRAVVFRPSDLPPEIGRSSHLYFHDWHTESIYKLMYLTLCLQTMLYNLSRLLACGLIMFISMWES
jgi:hypothetical protein